MSKILTTNKFVKKASKEFEKNGGNPSPIKLEGVTMEGWIDSMEVVAKGLVPKNKK